MMDKKQAAMADALAKRRGSGIDLNIIMGEQAQPKIELEQESKEESEMDGLAPEGAPKAEGEEEMGMGEELMGQMSGYEKDQMMKSEPKGLGAKAMKMAMERMKK